MTPDGFSISTAIGRGAYGTIGGAGHRWVMLAVAWLCLAVWCALPAMARFDHAHEQLTKELQKYVDTPLVHYARWKNDQAGLDRYLKQLAAISPREYERFTQDQKKALWINAYNAITIKIVLTHYPIRGDKPYYPPNSLRQIPNVWEDFKFTVAGKEVNLYMIEHDMIRKQLQDARMHFAVVCASRGCPPLLNRAYVPETLDKDLDEAARRYFAAERNVQYDPERKEVRVSQLFRWFPLDFANLAGFSKMPFPPPSDDAIVLSYVLSMAPAELRSKFPEKETRVLYMPFDWSLNDADATPVGDAQNKGVEWLTDGSMRAATAGPCCGGP
ncbi:MAG TPA: DUF547 domain-containing protein [Candidatus Obscuribacterales bacterium]